MTINRNTSVPAGTGVGNEVRQVGKNSLIYLVGQALSRAVGFLMIPLYTKYITPAGYGTLDLIETIMSAAAILVSMGISEGMTRFYYAEKDEDTRNQIISTIILGFSFVGIGVTGLLEAGSGYATQLIWGEMSYHYYFQVALASLWFSMLCEITFSYLRMKYLAKQFVVVTLLQVVLALTLNIYFIVVIQIDILGVLYSTLISQGLVAVVLSALILRKVGIQVSWPILRKLISFGAPLGPARIALLLGFASNRFALIWLSPAAPAVALAQVGLLSLGHKFGSIVNRFFTSPFNSFWGPRRMELLLSGDVTAMETIARFCTYATFCTAYLALLIAAVSQSVIALMADSSYEGSHVVVPFVAASYVVMSLETHFLTGLIHMQRTSYSMWISFLSLTVIVLWNIVFVPRYGLLAAATSNLVGMTVREILIYVAAQRVYALPFELGRLLAIGVGAVGLFWVSQLVTLPSTLLTAFLRAGIAGMLPIVLVVSGFLHAGEKAALRGLLRHGWTLMPRFVGHLS